MGTSFRVGEKMAKAGLEGRDKPVIVRIPRNTRDW